MAIKIFIDQGHNPSDINAGAETFGLLEQEVTYNVGINLAIILREDPRFEVLTPRTSPAQIFSYSNITSLVDRVRMANSWPADYFISIHCNANENHKISGPAAYVYSNYTQSYYLAEHILNSIVLRVSTRNNGLRINPTLYVLRNSNMPSVFLELVYLTNPSDNEKLRNHPWDFAYAIYNGLLIYFGFTV